MIEDEAARARSITALGFVYFFQERPERVWIIVRIGHQPHSHHASLELLFAAVANKWEVHSKGDAQLGNFVLPYLRWRYTCGNSNGSLHEKLAGQLYCPMTRCHVADLMGNHGRDFVVGGRDLE